MIFLRPLNYYKILILIVEDNRIFEAFAEFCLKHNQIKYKFFPIPSNWTASVKTIELNTYA